MSTLFSRRLLAAAFVAVAPLAAPAAFAQNAGCRTIALGIMRCDDAHSERTRDQVVAELHAPAPVPNPGCHTIANGIMRCDAPGGELTRTAVVADLRQAQAAGKMKVVGDLAMAPVSDPQPAAGTTLASAPPR
jgi:hypothetical protein